MRELTSAPVPPLGEDDHVRGDPGAPLVIVFADFTCPRCAVAAERLQAAPVRTCFRHFALRARHPRALATALAAEAAARQGAFWPFHDALYADQGRLDDPHLWALCDRLSASTSGASTPTGATRRPSRAWSATSGRRCARAPRRPRRWSSAVSCTRAHPIPHSSRGSPAALHGPLTRPTAAGRTTTMNGFGYREKQ